MQYWCRYWSVASWSWSKSLCNKSLQFCSFLVWFAKSLPTAAAISFGLGACAWIDVNQEFIGEPDWETNIFFLQAWQTWFQWYNLVELMYFQNRWHLDRFPVVKKQFLGPLFLLNSITDFGRQLAEHLASRGSRKKHLLGSLIKVWLLRVRKVINSNPVPSWHRLVSLSLPSFLLLPAPVLPPFSFWLLPFSFHLPIALPFPLRFPLHSS